MLWFAPHFNRWTTSGYWGLIAVTMLAGLMIGVSQLHGRDGSPTAGFLLVFLPLLIAAGWVILAAEPRGSWVRNHVLVWSADMGIGRAVHNLGEHVAILGFGLGLVFGLMFEPRMVRRRQRIELAARVDVAVPSPPPAPADRTAEEVTLVEPPAEQREMDAAPTVGPDASSDVPMPADPAGEEEPTLVEPPVREPEGSELEPGEPPA